jgi:hypothetical protein
MSFLIRIFKQATRCYEVGIYYDLNSSLAKDVRNYLIKWPDYDKFIVG